MTLACTWASRDTNYLTAKNFLINSVNITSLPTQLFLKSASKGLSKRLGHCRTASSFLPLAPKRMTIVSALPPIVSALPLITTPAASHRAAIMRSIISLYYYLCHVPHRPRAWYCLPGCIQEMSILFTSKPPLKSSLLCCSSVCLLCCFSSGHCPLTLQL